MRFFAYFVIPALGVHAISIVGSQSSTGAGILSRQIHNADFDKSFTSSDYHGEHNAKRYFFARIAHTIALVTGTNKNHQVMNFHDDKLSVGQAIESRQLGAASSVHDTSGALPSSALSIGQRDIAGLGTGTKKDHQVMNPNDEKHSVGQVIESRQLGVNSSVSDTSGPSGALPIGQRDLNDNAQTLGKAATGVTSGSSAAVNDNSRRATAQVMNLNDGKPSVGPAIESRQLGVASSVSDASACGQPTSTVPCGSAPIHDIASLLEVVV